MPIQTTGNLANSLRTRYTSDYLQAADMLRLYDLISAPVDKFGVEAAAKSGLGSSIQVNFKSDMRPGVTAISETADINPQVLRDATASISPTSRGEALDWSETLQIQQYTNYASDMMKTIGRNNMESVEILARDVATAGGNKISLAARASLDAGTATHRFNDASMLAAQATLQRGKCPPFMMNGRGQWLGLAHTDLYVDALSSGNIVSIAIYQDKELWFNGELGQFGPFKLIFSPWAKVFGAAASANASSVATTLNGAVSALAKSVVVASATNIVAGQLITIGTIETANTFYPTNELVKVDAGYVSGTTVNIIGEGANGGLRFDHASGESFDNHDNAYPVVYGGPQSIAKLYDTGMDNEFGTVVGPYEDGILRQFKYLGWKFYGNYGRWVESWLLRGEYSSSLQA